MFSPPLNRHTAQLWASAFFYKYNKENKNRFPLVWEPCKLAHAAVLRQKCSEREGKAGDKVLRESEWERGGVFWGGNSCHLTSISCAGPLDPGHASFGSGTLETRPSQPPVSLTLIHKVGRRSVHMLSARTYENDVAVRGKSFVRISLVHWILGREILKLKSLKGTVVKFGLIYDFYLGKIDIHPINRWINV